MLQIEYNQHFTTLNKRNDHHLLTNSLLNKRQITVISPSSNTNTPSTNTSPTSNSPTSDSTTSSNTPSNNPASTTTTTPTTTTPTTNTGNTNNANSATTPSTNTNDASTDKSTDKSTTTTNNNNNAGTTTTTKNPTDKTTTTTDSTNSTPLLPLPIVDNTTQSAAPAVASQATKASDTNKTVISPVAQSPTNVSAAHPSLATQAPASVVTQTNQAGVVVTQTMYASNPAATLGAGRTTTPSSAPSGGSSDDGTGTSVGTIMGIVVGVLIGVVILAGFIGMFLKKKKARMMTDYDDNPFLNDKYGADADYNPDPTGEGTHALVRSNTDRSRPRPPSILERHFGAPSLPAQSFQPGQVVNYSPPTNHFPPHPPALGSQFNHHQANYPPQAGYGSETGTGYGNEVATGGYGNAVATGGYGSAVAQGYNTHYNHSPPSRTVYPTEAMMYAQAPQAQDPSQGSLNREPSGKLKNPYEAVVEEEHRSGTPTQPNLQQSYFAVSHPDSLGSGAQSPAPIPAAHPPTATTTHVNKEDRAQRTLSVMNGEASFNDFHGF